MVIENLFFYTISRIITNEIYIELIWIGKNNYFLSKVSYNGFTCITPKNTENQLVDAEEPHDNTKNGVVIMDSLPRMVLPRTIQG